MKGEYLVLRDLKEFIIKKLKKCNKDSLLDIKIVYKKKFYGFNNNKLCPFLFLKFRNKMSMRNCSWIFKNPMKMK